MRWFMEFLHYHAFLGSVVRQCVWLLLLTIVFMPLERLFAINRRAFFSKRLAGDLGFFFISALVPALLLTPVFALVAAVTQRVMPSGYYEAVAAWPLWLRAVAALLVSEAGFYWGHRLTHEIPFLWRFHSVHHDPSEVYFLISARAHPVDNVFTRLCGLIPVYVLGIAAPLTPAGGATSALIVMVLTMWGFLIHANVRWRLGPLEWLVATPAFHHWHHTLPEPRDRNYASMLPCMDWIFGTFWLPRGQWPSAYGIEAKLPGSVAGLMLYPFVARPEPVGAAKPVEAAGEPV